MNLEGGHKLDHSRFSPGQSSKPHSACSWAPSWVKRVGFRGTSLGRTGMELFSMYLTEKSWWLAENNGHLVREIWVGNSKNRKLPSNVQMAILQSKKRKTFPGRTMKHRVTMSSPASKEQKWCFSGKLFYFLENSFIFIVEISPEAYSKLRMEKKSPRRSMQISSQAEHPFSLSWLPCSI